MAEEKTIRRRQLLDELDIRKTPVGRNRVFSIKFVTKEGKLIFLPQAFACGVGRMNNKLYRTHVYPVRIYNIIQYQGKRVISNEE